jgi:hypothetical protein
MGSSYPEDGKYAEYSSEWRAGSRQYAQKEKYAPGWTQWR